MPQLPQYQQQVLPNPPSGGVLNLQARNPLGGLVQGAQEATRNLAEAQFYADNTKSDILSNQVQEEVLKRTAAFKASTGGAVTDKLPNGMTPRQSLQTDLDNYISKTLKDASPAIQRLTQHKIAPTLRQFEQHTMAHETDQINVLSENTLNSKVSLATLAAEQSPIDEAISGTSRTTALDAATLEADRRGWTGENYKDVRQAFIASKTSPVIFATTSGLIKAGQTEVASKYLAKHKDSLTPHDYEVASGLLKTNMDTNAASAIVDEVDGPVDAQLRKPTTEVLKGIKARAGGNSELEKLARHEYEVRRHAVATDDKKRGDDLGGSVAQIAGTQGYGTALRSTQLQQMLSDPSPDVRENGFKWQTHLRSLQRMDVDRYRAEPPTLQQQADMFKAMENPSLAAWSDASILAMEPKLGYKGTQELLQHAHQVRTSPVKQQQLKDDKDQLVTELRLITNPATQKPWLTGNEKPEEVARIISPFQYRLKQRQETSGQPWSLEQSRKWIHELAALPVESGATTWHLFSPTTNDVVPLITAMEKPIPQPTQDAITANLRKLNGPNYQPTAAELLNAFGVYKRKNLVDQNGNLMKGSNTALTVDGAK